MKKLLFALSISAFASSAFSLDVSNATSADNPLSLGTEFNILTSNRSNEQMEGWTDYYLYIDQPTFGGLMYSTGSRGGHANYHVYLDSANANVTTSRGDPIGFNTNPDANGKRSSAAYYLESRDGTAVSLTSTADKVSLNLTSDDARSIGNTDNVVYGKRGNIFGIGNNVTFNVKALEMNGRLRSELPPSETEDSAVIVSGTLNAENDFSVVGSNLVIKSGGNVNVGGHASFTDNNGDGRSALTVENGATLAFTGTSMTTGFGAVDAAIAGTVKNSAGMYIYSGANVVVEETGAWMGMAVLRGGSFTLNGGYSDASGNAIALAMESGTLAIGASADVSKLSAIEMRTGSFTFASDVSVDVLRTDGTNTSNATVADGFTFKANKTNFKKGSAVTLNGNYEFAEYMHNYGNLTINGSVVAGTAANDKDAIIGLVGDITIANGGSLKVVNNLVGAWGSYKATRLAKITVDGGTLSIEGTKESINSAVSGTLTLKNGGKLKTLSGNFIGLVADANLVADKTSKIDTQYIIFDKLNGADAPKSITLGGGNVFGGEFWALRTSGNVVALAAGEDYLFSALKFHGWCNGVPGSWNDITFDLNGANSLTIQKLYGNGTELTGGTLIFTDFVNNVVKIANLDESMVAMETFAVEGANVKLKAYDKNGSELTGGNWIIQDGYLNYIVPVPEPAEWAMILGAITLSLAIYRRRK